MVTHVPTPLLPVMEQVQLRASSRQREGHAPLASEWVHEQVSILVGLVCHWSGFSLPSISWQWESEGTPGLGSLAVIFCARDLRNENITG